MVSIDFDTGSVTVFLLSRLIVSQSTPDFTLSFNLRLFDDAMGFTVFFLENSSCWSRACSALALMAAFGRGCLIVMDADRVGVVVPVLLLGLFVSPVFFVAVRINLDAVVGDSHTGANNI